MKARLVLLLSTLGALLSAVSLNAATDQVQNLEYGKPAELKGLHKVFVNTGSDLTERDNIVATIEKANLPGLVLLDSADGAEVLLVYQGRKEADSNTETGAGRVFINGKSPDRLRLLLSVDAVRKGFLQDKPSAKFAKGFVAAYQKANGLK